MKTQNRWVLPEGIEDILPPFAMDTDALCRELIDLYVTWGYQLVIPPFVEYVESLLVGINEDMDSQMFKVTDQLNGRLMGLRVDITPQVARVDAYMLKRDTPTRLCYVGTVLHALPGRSGGTRSPLQVGAELYGHHGVDSDGEILCLMIETLQKAGINNIHIDLGHVGIYNRLVGLAGIDDAHVEKLLFKVLQRKFVAELEAMVSDELLSVDAGRMFKRLMDAHGHVSELHKFSAIFADHDLQIKRYFADLEEMIRFIEARFSDVTLSFDLSELDAYRYHSGIVFTAYIAGRGQGIAFGGRYDSMGTSFERSRQATGFSVDVKTLLELGNVKQQSKMGIYAPCSEHPEQLEVVNNLRKQGEIVICELAEQNDTAEDMGCDRTLVLRSDQWVVV